MTLAIGHELLERHIPSDTSPDRRPLCLVLERSPLVAEDLMGALGADGGPWRMRHVHGMDELRAALEANETVGAAFLEARLSDLVEAGLDRLLAERGVRVVLTAGEDQRAAVLARGYGYLQRPFSDTMIRHALSVAAAPKPESGSSA